MQVNHDRHKDLLDQLQGEPVVSSVSADVQSVGILQPMTEEEKK